jgi:hypothetical protein
MTIARRGHALRTVRIRGDAAAQSGFDRGQVVPLHVVCIAAKVLGWELPVARHDPLMGRDDFDAAFASVNECVDVPRHFAKVFAQRGSARVERREPEPFVTLQLRHRNQA